MKYDTWYERLPACGDFRLLERSTLRTQKELQPHQGIFWKQDTVAHNHNCHGTGTTAIQLRQDLFTYLEKAHIRQVRVSLRQMHIGKQNQKDRCSLFCHILHGLITSCIKKRRIYRKGGIGLPVRILMEMQQLRTSIYVKYLNQGGGGIVCN